MNYDDMPQSESLAKMSLGGQPMKEFNPKMRDKIARQKAAIQKELDRLTKIEEFLDKNPQFEEFQDLVRNSNL